MHHQTTTRARPMTQPLLSICIPTYNREKFLAKLLQSIDAQNAPSELYEVHVRDNASTDNSAALFQKIANGRPNWHWHANPRNVGGRANIRLASLDANGQFLWIVGSDDHLIPGALNTLFEEMLPPCSTGNAAGLFLCKRLNPIYSQARPFTPAFAWLRDVSVNVPAFISAIVWNRDYWRQYPYEKYPDNLSLPQLDAVVKASLEGRMFGCNRELVAIDTADSGTSTSYWYYRRYPIDNAIEYPLLYKQILRSPRLDFRTRCFVILRRFSNLRQMLSKLIFMRYNQQYYHMRARNLKDANGNMWLWPLVWLMAKLILEWPPGNWLARRKWKATEKLPAADRMESEF